jgi:hypothetical protein
MKSTPCPRLFEAAAMRDGRLTGAPRTSFERHTRVCAACAHEVEELEALAEAYRATPSKQADELRSRRERTRLLAAFDRELLVAKGGGEVRHRLVWPAAGMAFVAALLLVWRVHPWHERPAHVEASRAAVHADPATAWSERVDGDREVVALEHGALSIRVDHAASAGRLVVILPDGELEDTGTTFMVSADSGRTTRVAVQQGSVVLRLRGQLPIAVGAGDVWTPAAAPATASACASSTPSSEPSSTAPPRSSPVTSNAQPPRVPTWPELAHDASADFSGPMTALNRGDNRAAAEGFARFLRDHPGDSRAEDAMYLRVIALQRCGDQNGIRAAALEYLQRYPLGFRRAEVETLSQ